MSELCQSSSVRFKNRIAFEIYRDAYTYDRITYGEFGGLARRFASLLISLGVKPADRVMLIAENRPEWAIAYFGIAQAGAVCIPLLVDFSREQIRAIISHAGPSALCVTEKTLPNIAGIPEEDARGAALPVIYLDSIENMRTETRAQRNEPDASALVSIRGSVKRLFLRDRERFPDTEEDGVAAIVYTSGTLGDSKGVMLSNRNLVWTARAACKRMKIYPRDRCLSVIPLAHTYECTIGLISIVFNGASVVYLDRPPSPSVLADAMQALKPTLMLTVPLFIEKLYHSRIAPRLSKSVLYRFPLTRRIAERLAGRALLAAFGGGLRFLGVGGAALADEVERFLWNAQFPYAPGYGLTEASPLVAGTAPYRFRFRSSGKPLEGVEARVAARAGDRAEDFAAARDYSDAGGYGEIQVRGPNVMSGYYRNEQATREAFTEDGWLKTGDAGYVDGNGYLFIRGRLKTMIVTSSGENIYPEDIELLLRQSPLVEDALVCSGENGELVALIVPSAAAYAAMEKTETRDTLRRSLNKRLAAFSRIDRIEVMTAPFEKTPTGKIKRFLYTRSCMRPARPGCE
ncbi:MAG: AMP-binding protein [Treponema sp.]|nr:AMP-binding protein [Treponema sp.]